MTYKLLLADDSVTIQKVVELTFSDEDFNIISVGDGNTAFEKIRNEKPDIVLSDVIMPGMNGYELCSKVKQEQDMRNIPFLFLKGTFESFDEERANSVGADGYIIKPFESQELISKVKELVGKYRGAVPPAEEVVAPGFQAETTVLPVEEIPTGALWQEAPAGVTPVQMESLQAERPIAGEPSRMAEAEEPAEEDLWSEVNISDHPIPQVAEGLDFEEGVPSSSLLETPMEASMLEQEQPVEEIPQPEEAAGFEELAVAPEESFADLNEQMPEIEEISPVEAPRVEVPRVEAPWVEVPRVEAPPPVMPEVQAAPAAQAEVAGVSAESIERIAAAKVEEVMREQFPAIIQEVARKVISEVVWEVVPEIAEKLIKREIERLTGQGAG